ncbi:trichohyalin-like isoform X2 [Ptychodera flava]|uniref:trichohyalin-like isoform X2 n=1 Tax=Ptychodera flava TaxID=63121 RepID=UPI003969CAFA
MVLTVGESNLPLEEAELDAIYTILDPMFQGYITVQQLKDFHEAIYFSSIDKDQVSAAVEQVCGEDADEKCTREHFMPVLLEMERRKSLEQKLLWDFKALDTTGTSTISVKDALLLFRATHEEKFSISTWRKFMKSRDFSSDPVSFHEIRMWLCSIPTGDPMTESEFQEEKEKLESELRRRESKRYEQAKQLLQEDDQSIAKTTLQNEAYQDKFQRSAKRKLNRWEQQGIEALIFDDGEDVDVHKPRDRVGVNDLLDALENKYDILREKLFWELIQKNVGDTVWSTLSESEQQELLLQLKVKEKRYRRENKVDKVGELAESQQLYERRLIATMGELLHIHENRRIDDESKRSQWLSDGKTDDDINETLNQEYQQLIKGESTSGELLIDLHQRHSAEKENLLARLSTGSSRTLTKAEMITQYAHILCHLRYAQQEESFEFANTATGLAERPQLYKSAKFDYDRSRQESLALHRLQTWKSKKSTKFEDERLHDNLKKGVVDLHEDIVTTAVKKHAHESEVMIYLLQGKESETAKSAGRRLSKDQRDKRLKELRAQRTNWRQSPSQYLMSKRSLHRRLLQEGVGLYHEQRREEVKFGHNLVEIMVSANVLADLQQKQDREMNLLISNMQNKSLKDLTEMKKFEERSLVEEWLDNISAVVLGTFELTHEEQQLIQSLESKYDIIREKLLSDSLIRQHGDVAWKNMSSGEREKLLEKKILEERRLRQEGKLDELGRLLGDFAKLPLDLEDVMGRIKLEYDKKFQEKQARLNQDPQMADSEIGEPPPVRKTGNLLGDLQHRYEEDMEDLMSMLRGEGGKILGEQERGQLLGRLKRETFRAVREEKFVGTALMVGMAERCPININIRITKDKSRQRRLAAVRYNNRQHRKKQGLFDEPEFDDQALPPKGDLDAWKLSVMRELDKYYKTERDLMMSILTDEGSEDLRQAAVMMPPDDRQKRLMELKQKRESLEYENKDDQEINLDILEECGAIKSVVRRLVLEERSKGGVVGHEEIVISLLSELQDEQDREGEMLFATLVDKEEDDLSAMRHKQIMMRKSQFCDNILEVFTRYEGAGSEDELLKALDDKYDALRDQLLLEALKKQMSDAEWQRLSEAERQQKLMKMKLEAARLKREGKQDELARLLGENFKIEANLKSLMGENRAKYEQKLRDRLEKRKQQGKEGYDSEDEDGIPEDEEDDETSKNPLVDLERRYEDERDALMARLRDTEEAILSEKERQQELARLKRERRKAQREDNFESAALVLGLAERHQAAAAERLKNDRARQEELAKKRLDALRKKRTAGEKAAEPSDEIVNNGNRADMQDAVLRALENKHIKERETLLELLQDESNQELRDIASVMTEEQIEDKLEELEAERKRLPMSDSDGRRRILQHGAYLKLVSRLSKLKRSSDKDVSKDDAIVSLMADLQEQQDKESEELIKHLSDQDLADLVKAQEQQIKERKEERNENIAVVLLRRESAKKTGENELVEAIEGKYDALKDKLIAEALMMEMGEAEWNNLTEKERQAKIFKLKIEERRLREEGKYEEAAKLLGDVIKTQSALESLMGDNRAEYEQKLKERLEKRKQRLAEGMTEEEVDELEKKEALEEEEEMKNRPRPRNILEDLDRRCLAEKEALLALLRNQDERFNNERLRQAELMRLKREQRQARLEDKFETAARLMGLADHHDDVLARERARQLELAKQRLAERKKRLTAAKENREAAEEDIIGLPEDEHDTAALQDALLKEMEQKHRAERELLIQMLQEQENSTEREAARQMDEDQRSEKLNELSVFREQWRETASDPQEQMDIFREASALRVESRLSELIKSSEDGKATEEDAQTSLLADLQQQQDQETQYLMTDIHTKSAATLKQLKLVHNTARTQKWYDNVATTLLGGKQKMTTEETLMKALEDKYDALRDKLLAEALMKQLGEAEWANLTEKERQAQLMKMKLEEKRLRQEGKYDEAAALLGESLQNEQELTRLLGDTKSRQEEKLKERLKRQKELKAQRAAEGLPADDETLREILDEEERQEEEKEMAKRRNILEELNHHYEDEKEALMAALRGQDQRFMTERERQFALAKLRREQLRMKQEDKFDSAAMLFSIAQQNEATRHASVSKDRERQKQLAKERLEAAKKRRASKDVPAKSSILERLIQEEEDNKKTDAMFLFKKNREGIVALQEAVLVELEKKHQKESDMLLQLIQTAERNKPGKELAKKLSDEKLREKLQHLEEKRRRWRKKSQKDADVADFHDLPPEKLGEHLTKLAANQERQYDIMEESVLHKVEETRRSLTRQASFTEEELSTETAVSLMSSLQEKQQTESTAMSSILASEKQAALFENLKEDQRRSRREGWFDNLAMTVLGTSPLQVMRTESMVSIRSADIKELESEIKNLDSEHEKQKQEITERARRDGKAIDAQAMLAELENQHAAKKKAMQQQLEKQKQQMKERLELKRMARDEKQFEEVMAIALLKNAERTQQLQEMKDTAEKDRQGDMMKEKLAARREQRKKVQQAKEDVQRKKEQEDKEKKQREMNEESRRVEEEAKKKATTDDDQSKRSAASSELPPIRLKREKTVLDVEVSEEKKKQIFSALVREQTSAQLKIAKQQQKQADMLKEKLDQRKTRRHDEAAAVVGLGVKHKTMLERTQKEERERQINTVKERIARVRYERTMTMKQRAAQNTKTFNEMLEPIESEETQGDEKMANLAAQMNERFKKDELEVKKGVKSKKLTLPPVAE